MVITLKYKLKIFMLIYFSIVILSLLGGYYFTKFGCALSLLVTSVIALVTYVISYLGVAILKNIYLIYIS